jgi:hypothetical protein
MKTWVEAGLTELNIEETAQCLSGNTLDGGYIGDGHIGVLEWSCGGSGDGGNTDNGGDNGSTSEGGVDSLS